ncbi:hypothetical protein T265_01496 [Opisthorchis viverrini]|uniref:Uncharacterized protein n=1 Tax=Opisthorchis viverrini TaxID=6198 RepID=A0A075A2G0_OPIVI|nr:hypothetical protein T265_01496 [Opisthorchis viverrini]KER32442.1 hypothetical protein T265_01496 [Opisthorchis viverrini]
MDYLHLHVNWPLTSVLAHFAMSTLIEPWIVNLDAPGPHIPDLSRYTNALLGDVDLFSLFVSDRGPKTQVQNIVRQICLARAKRLALLSTVW